MTVPPNEAPLKQISRADIKRFVVHSALLNLIDPVRQEPTRTPLDENLEGESSGAQQLKQKFLDAFALICSTSGSGAKSASAVCLEQYSSAGAILRVARNYGFTPKDLSGIESVLQMLRVVARKGTYILYHPVTVTDAVGNAEKSSAQVELDILDLVTELDKGRILSIVERVEKRGIRDSLREARSRLLAGQVKPEISDKAGLRLWLASCPFTAACFQTWSSAIIATLIGWASQARWLYSEQLPDLLGFNPTQKPAWLDGLHKIARYHSAIRSMIKLATKQPEIFTDISIREIEAPNLRPFSLANEKAPLLTTVKNLVREDSGIVMERLEKHLGTQDAEARLRKACRLSLTLHAEMQIIVFYEVNSSLAPRMPFIGASKKACFLCYQYLQLHPLRLQVSACHQKIYPSWMPPPYYPIPGQFKSTPFVKLSKMIEQLTRQELKSALTAPRRPNNQDSTAGPSLTTDTTNWTWNAIGGTNISVGDHRDLLDIIDSLRSQGVSYYVDLPQIIVCGDQSAGKSSVLEAISGMKFPTKDGVCTRFATELILRRGREVNTKVSITPGESRFGEDKERLECWQPKLSIDKVGLGAVTEEAMRAMSDSAGTGEFYDDILRIELTGPEQPHLTMVDLPGLFRRGNKEQSDADVHIVRGMVQRYMARPRSIILSVVSAKSEYVLQEVTLMAKHADPDGLRTLGLITKPDTLDVGSESERYYVRLAQNLEEELRLGWHVLKNRKFEEREVTSAERDAIESEFFSQGLWDSIDSAHCGVAALRLRLSTVLRDQILTQLPSLVLDVENGIRDCADRLDRLGPVRGTPKQQLSYLMRVSEEYTSLVTQAVDGTYTDRFFGNRKKRDKFNTRLRAVVQSRLHDFGEEMRLNGQSQYIFDSESEDESDHTVRDLPRICRSDYVEDVAGRLKFSKGRELQGLFNPLIVTDLFIEQCEPWARIARALVEDILGAVHQTTQLIVERIAASDVAEGVLKLIRQGIDGLKVTMDAQVGALLASTAQHPITYNPQLTKTVQRIQQARQKRAFKTIIRKTFGSTRFDDPNSKISVNPVALSRFIDDISVLAIEDCLISKLPTLFRSSNVLHMSDEDIFRLAGETQESSIERKRLEGKRETLETGLQGLKNLLKRRNIVSLPNQDQAKDSEQTFAVTPSKSEELSIATNSADSVVSDKASRAPDKAAALQPSDERPPQVEFSGDTDADFAVSIPKRDKKKALKHVIVENLPVEDVPIDQGWKY
ncbi:hypothetical protein ARSEF4850_006795 [Beauveria asiatica]